MRSFQSLPSVFNREYLLEKVGFLIKSVYVDLIYVKLCSFVIILAGYQVMLQLVSEKKNLNSLNSHIPKRDLAKHYKVTTAISIQAYYIIKFINVAQDINHHSFRIGHCQETIFSIQMLYFTRYQP